MDEQEGDAPMQMYRAKAERKCRCGAKIAAGAAYYGFRERATCSAEARNAGTLYPKRILCLPCGEKRKGSADRSSVGSAT
jgi:hypothetical protein